MLWHLPPGIPDAVTVETLALRARVGVYSFASARVISSGGPRSPRARSSSAMPRCRRSRSKRASRGCRTPSTMRSTIPQPTWRHFSPTSPSRPPAAPLSRQQLAPRYRQQPALRSRSAPRATSAGNYLATRFRANAGFEEHLPLSDQGIERAAADARRYRGQKAVPARSDLCLGAPGRAVRHRSAADGAKKACS